MEPLIAARLGNNLRLAAPPLGEVRQGGRPGASFSSRAFVENKVYAKQAEPPYINP
ncbi:MAG: hypothetical protein M3362_25000 [Acidobacteriota bacterium]|nr:hypothetical protein [Acidobacteriota bacterium]